MYVSLRHNKRSLCIGTILDEKARNATIDWEHYVTVHTFLEFDQVHVV